MEGCTSAVVRERSYEGNGTGNFSCTQLFYIDPSDRCIVGDNLRNEIEDDFLNGASNKSTSYILSYIAQDVSDEKSERTHFYDSAALLVIMSLLFLTVITIWVFKVRRFRVLHESGLALIYGELILELWCLCERRWWCLQKCRLVSTQSLLHYWSFIGVSV